MILCTAIFKWHCTNGEEISDCQRPGQEVLFLGGVHSQVRGENWGIKILGLNTKGQQRDHYSDGAAPYLNCGSRFIQLMQVRKVKCRHTCRHILKHTGTWTQAADFYGSLITCLNNILAVTLHKSPVVQQQKWKMDSTFLWIYSIWLETFYYFKRYLHI